MTAQLRSELRKMRSTRTNVGLLLGLVGVILFGVVAGSFGTEAELSLLDDQRELVGNGAFAAAFAALIGVLAMTSESRHGTIRATLVFTPARPLVVFAKVLASALVGIAFGALGAALALGAGVVTIRGHGHDVLLDSGDIGRLLLGTIVMAALWAALGVGVGGVLRNQVLTIVGLFGWVFVIETLLLRHLPDVGRYAPGAAGTAVTGDTVGDSTVDLLAPVTGGVLLAAYALVFVVAGAFVTSRRDIT